MSNTSQHYQGLARVRGPYNRGRVPGTVGYRLTQLRKLSKRTQHDLSQEALCETTTWGAWERAESMPTILDITRMAEMFQVSLYWLLTGKFQGDPYLPPDPDALPVLDTVEQYREERKNREDQESAALASRKHEKGRYA